MQIQHTTIAVTMLFCLAVSGCTAATGNITTTPLRNNTMARAPTGAPLPGNTSIISRILIASCFDEEKKDPDPVMLSIARQPADLLLMLGDNVYGDFTNGRYDRQGPTLPGLRQSYATLARRTDFAVVRKQHPVMAVWDDHDFGRNDGGGSFAHKQLAETLHETFWGLDNGPAATRPGVYYAESFGPPGRRVQVIMLDTRFFRSDLTRTDQRGAPGKERYIPSTASQQVMLGDTQLRWLKDQLAEPADLRIIASSIQVLPTGHGWESWSRLPRARTRLLEALADTGDAAIVIVSGDRHHAFTYKTTTRQTTLIELTASSVNRSFLKRMRGKHSREFDPLQTNPAWSGPNFGAVQIDWARRTLNLQVLDKDGETVRSATQGF